MNTTRVSLAKLGESYHSCLSSLLQFRRPLRNAVVLAATRQDSTVRQHGSREDTTLHTERRQEGKQVTTCNYG